MAGALLVYLALAVPSGTTSVAPPAWRTRHSPTTKRSADAVEAARLVASVERVEAGPLSTPIASASNTGRFPGMDRPEARAATVRALAGAVRRAPAAH